MERQDDLTGIGHDHARLGAPYQLMPAEPRVEAGGRRNEMTSGQAAKSESPACVTALKSPDPQMRQGPLRLRLSALRARLAERDHREAAMDTDPTAQRDHDILASLNRDYIASVQHGDVHRFREILADDFQCSNPDGSLVDRTRIPGADCSTGHHQRPGCRGRANPSAWRYRHYPRSHELSRCHRRTKAWSVHRCLGATRGSVAGNLSPCHALTASGVGNLSVALAQDLPIDTKFRNRSIACFSRSTTVEN